MTLSIASLSPSDIAAIEATHREFVRATISQDFGAVAALYTDDATLMPPHQPAVHGRTAIKAWMATFPRITRFEFENHEIDGRADLAFVRGAYRMELRPDGAPAASDNGKYIEIRRRQPDGSWLIAADIFNSDNA